MNPNALFRLMLLGDIPEPAFDLRDERRVDREITNERDARFLPVYSENSLP